MVTRALIVVALATACTQGGIDAPAPTTMLDRPFFTCQVEPVLVARCAFFACHGSARRPFHVLARNRLRDGVPDEQRETPLTTAEEDANYATALGFTGDGTRAPALLLLKPLSTKAGGFYHRGATLYDRGDVFSSKSDPGYQILSSWLAGATAAPDCTPTTAVGP